MRIALKLGRVEQESVSPGIVSSRNTWVKTGGGSNIQLK